jgi:hypothetical protein
MNATSSDRPRCGLCGKTGKLTRTPCCGNWICDDADQYVPFSYERNSCFTNHSKYTICAFHHHGGHAGRWQDCAQCRENGPLEMYVHSATNEYNFEKLENPPAFEPTHCRRCGVRVRLAHDGYTMSGEGVLCLACGEARQPGASEAMARALGGARKEHADEVTELADYPIGTLAYYGPTNRLATKIAAAIVRHPGAEPDPMHRWITQAGDIRDDRAIARQVAAFFRRHRIRQIASTRRIMGCPHEEGKDYPEGGKCPHCAYWHDRDRFSLEPLPEGGMSAAEILADLTKPSPTRPPIEALAAAEHHRQDLIEPLLRALERGIGYPKGTPPGESMLFTYAAYLLAKWREPRAYPLFIRWLSLPGQGAFDIGGDTATHDGRRLLASVCGGDLEPIKQLILNREADEFCRAAAIESLALLAAREEVPQQIVSDYFLWLAREGLEREPSFVWDGLANSCADIEALEVFPELRRAYEEGLVEPGVMQPEELDQVEAGPRGQWLARFREQHPPIGDVAKETSWWQCFRDDPLQDVIRDAAYEGAQSQWQPQPSRATPKVGRNDPCPCGSGKKYKKCCGK